MGVRSLVSVSSSVFWSLWYIFLAACVTSGPARYPSELRAELLATRVVFGLTGGLCSSDWCDLDHLSYRYLDVQLCRNRTWQGAGQEGVSVAWVFQTSSKDWVVQRARGLFTCSSDWHGLHLSLSKSFYRISGLYRGDPGLSFGVV